MRHNPLEQPMTVYVLARTDYGHPVPWSSTIVGCTVLGVFSSLEECEKEMEKRGNNPPRSDYAIHRHELDLGRVNAYVLLRHNRPESGDTDRSLLGVHLSDAGAKDGIRADIEAYDHQYDEDDYEVIETVLLP